MSLKCVQVGFEGSNQPVEVVLYDRSSYETVKRALFLVLEAY